MIKKVVNVVFRVPFLASVLWEQCLWL